MRNGIDSVLDPLNNLYTRFTRSVYSSTGDKQYPLQRAGSGTIIAYQGDFYLVTARHIFENNQADPKSVFVSFAETGIKWWPTNACIHLEASEEFADDNTFGDLAIYSLDTSETTRSTISDHEFLPFPSDVNLSQEIPLYAFGYPDAEVEIDLNRNQHILTAVTVEGFYSGPTKSLGIHLFESPDLPPNLNGMSGGPITYLDNTKIGRHLLAGIIVQGGCQRLHFIGADMVRKALLSFLPDFRYLRENTTHAAADCFERLPDPG